MGRSSLQGKKVGWQRLRAWMEVFSRQRRSRTPALRAARPPTCPRRGPKLARLYARSRDREERSRSDGRRAGWLLQRATARGWSPRSWQQDPAPSSHEPLPQHSSDSRGPRYSGRKLASQRLHLYPHRRGERSGVCPSVVDPPVHLTPLLVKALAPLAERLGSGV
jgi:hypothetical protein